MLENMLIRYGEPSKLDCSPFGTICKRKVDDKFEIYLQVSDNESSPYWEKIGIFSDDLDPVIEQEINIVLSRKKINSI